MDKIRIGDEHRDWFTELRRWAKDKGLKIHFVDNCWIRVDASAVDVDQFLQAARERLRMEIPSPPLLLNERYLLVAEEF